MYNIGTGIHGERPALEALIGSCLMAWPCVEAEMAILLGHLLGTKDTAALSVFQILRRSTNQREAISAAAGVSLAEQDKELVSAILNLHKSIETERNALAHGHFGIATSFPDHLLWMDSTDYLSFQFDIKITRPEALDVGKLESRLWVYKKDDLESLLEDIKQIGFIWYELVEYLRASDEPRAAAYRRLCDQPRIAQELLILRQKSNPATRPG